jgi:hypothetical protein
MNRPQAILALSALFLSMFWSIGTIYGIVIVFLIRPLILAATFATFWKTKKRMKRMTYSLIGVVLCIALSSMTYGFQTEWWYVLEDSETQGAIFLIAIWTAFLTVISTELALFIKQKADPGATGQCR